MTSPPPHQHCHSRRTHARAHTCVHHKYTVFLQSGVNPPSLLKDSFSACACPLKHETPPTQPHPQRPTDTRGGPSAAPHPPTPFHSLPFERKEKKILPLSIRGRLCCTFLRPPPKCVAYMAGPDPTQSLQTLTDPPVPLPHLPKPCCTAVRGH